MTGGFSPLYQDGAAEITGDCLGPVGQRLGRQINDMKVVGLRSHAGFSPLPCFNI